MIKKKFYLGVLIMGISLALLVIFLTREPLEYGKKNIYIGNRALTVEIADTDEKRTLGLSGRKNLAENEGMLFVFDTPDYYKFWMPNMNFPIDIIWIDENKKIISITENAQPLHRGDKPTYYTPQQPAKYVLEVNADFSKSYSFLKGEIVRF